MKYVERLYFCPRCGQNASVEWLGALPYSVEYEEGVHLIDDDGVTTGPYEDEEEAQESLWAWFDKRGKVYGASKKGKLQKGNLRLVTFEGVSLEEGSEERGEGGEEKEADEETGGTSSSRSQDGEGGGG